MIGRIIKCISNDYTVLADDKTYLCKSRGKFRKLQLTPLVGDLVKFDEQHCYILEILPRKNSLVRPPVANIDQAILITSVRHPDFSSHLLDKLITVVEFNHIKPIICFTKLDLLEEKEKAKMEKIISYYREIGYEVFTNTEVEKIKEIFKQKVSVFTGQTGAGKSTLLNNLDSTLQIKTGEISMALGRGRHTTRHTELLSIEGGLVADTPGFSALSLEELSPEDIRDQFVEFNQYRHLCKYKDCMHRKEQHCMIKEKVEDGTILKSRYDNYLNFIEK
ncbi:MAG TPA: ribosome small subunit-dependent GTPase A [Candidatus Pelethosoma merdigallinarum]|nr:ribosome small subunit-dependent GTPase A [Candidatus Pelethosoma merdigallinarum]